MAKPKVQDVSDDIERVHTLRTEGKEDAARDLAEEIDEAIRLLPTRSQGPLLKALSKAEAAPLPAEGEATKETLVFDHVPGGEKLQEEIIEAVGEGLRASAALDSPAKRLARLRLDFGLRLKNKHGDPDIQLTSQRAKALRDDVLKVAGLTDTDDDRVEVFDRLWTAVKWQSRGVKIDYVKSLDSNPEEAARFKAALAAYPELPASEAVFKFHKVPHMTVREERTLREREKRELEAGGESDPYTPAIERAEKAAARLTKEAAVSKLSPEQRAELRERIDDLTSALALARARLKS